MPWYKVKESVVSFSQYWLLIQISLEWLEEQTLRRRHLPLLMRRYYQPLGCKRVAILLGIWIVIYTRSEEVRPERVSPGRRLQQSRGSSVSCLVQFWGVGLWILKSLEMWEALLEMSRLNLRGFRPTTSILSLGPPSHSTTNLSPFVRVPLGGHLALSHYFRISSPSSRFSQLLILLTIRELSSSTTCSRWNQVVERLTSWQLLVKESRGGARSWQAY